MFVDRDFVEMRLRDSLRVMRVERVSSERERLRGGRYNLEGEFSLSLRARS